MKLIEELSDEENEKIKVILNDLTKVIESHATNPIEAVLCGYAAKILSWKVQRDLDDLHKMAKEAMERRRSENGK
jgi:intracellular sulfur oxidation DsrE/DsrF family protein